MSDQKRAYYRKLNAINKNKKLKKQKRKDPAEFGVGPKDDLPQSSLLNTFTREAAGTAAQLAIQQATGVFVPRPAIDFVIEQVAGPSRRSEPEPSEGNESSSLHNLC